MILHIQMHHGRTERSSRFGSNSVIQSIVTTSSTPGSTIAMPLRRALIKAGGMRSAGRFQSTQMGKRVTLSILRSKPHRLSLQSRVSFVSSRSYFFGRTSMALVPGTAMSMAHRAARDQRRCCSSRIRSLQNEERSWRASRLKASVLISAAGAVICARSSCAPRCSYRVADRDRA
jgi:hypothetical protein